VREQHPVYLQLRQQLLLWIEQKQLDSQDKLPAERELAQHFNTTRVTLRQALSQLEAEGRVYRSNRRGWFITPLRIAYDPSIDVGFYQYVKDQGMVPRTKTISRNLVETPAWLAEKTQLALGEAVYQFVRRRYVNERAVLIEHNYISSASCPGLLDKNTDHSLWQILRDDYQLNPAERAIEIYPQAILAEQAELLNISQGSAGLYLERQSSDQHGNFLEFDQEYWIHDALKLVVNIARTE